MARRIARDPIYSGRRFSAETIETCVRWYITYRLSYRDLVAMMAEQGTVLAHGRDGRCRSRRQGERFTVGPK